MNENEYLQKISRLIIESSPNRRMSIQLLLVSKGAGLIILNRHNREEMIKLLGDIACDKQDAEAIIRYICRFFRTVRQL